MSSSYSIQHLRETVEIIAKINPDDCEKCVAELRATRDRGGRLFILGVGGSAANASHAGLNELDALLRSRQGATQ